MNSTLRQKRSANFLQRVLPIGGIALFAVASLPAPAHAQAPGPCDTPNTCTIWPASQTPAAPSANDPSAAELGVKFRTTSNGWITAIHFYKGSQNTGIHIANLWSG